MRQRPHTLRVLSPGTKLGRYEIRSRLSAGGMGEVYLAQDTRLDRKAAVKILLEGASGSFRRTANLLRLRVTIR
jgi:serine/threonine protein kinase